MEFKVDFITYEGIYKTFMSEKLNVPTSDGRRTILSNHMPLILPLDIGVIETKENNELKHYAINNAVLYFENNVAEIVADSVIDVKDIDLEQALEDKKTAEENLKKTRREYEKFRDRNKLEVANNLIAAAEKYLNHE
ncbi:MAG: ATP synthase F1 subunit epsilon [Erysipelotrichaceae bacterium]|nr:ATP synthase F1 subunit epsilon [Erysipelotrichaceae bacterium]